MNPSVDYCKISPPRPLDADWLAGAHDIRLDQVGLLDTNGSHHLMLDNGSDLTAEKTLSILCADDYSFEITGNSKINQDVSTSATPTFDQLNLNDLNDDHNLTIAVSNNFAGPRTLNIYFSGAGPAMLTKTITLNGSPTLNDWFDQSVKTSGTPLFAKLSVGASDVTGKENVLFLSPTTTTNYGVWLTGTMSLAGTNTSIGFRSDLTFSPTTGTLASGYNHDIFSTIPINKIVTTFYNNYTRTRTTGTHDLLSNIYAHTTIGDYVGSNNYTTATTIHNIHADVESVTTGHNHAIATLDNIYLGSSVFAQAGITDYYQLRIAEFNLGANNYEIMLEGGGGIFFRDSGLHIESQNDGYIDYIADTGHRFSGALSITGTTTLNTALSGLLKAASGVVSTATVTENSGALGNVTTLGMSDTLTCNVTTNQHKAGVFSHTESSADQGNICTLENNFYYTNTGSSGDEHSLIQNNFYAAQGGATSYLSTYAMVRSYFENTGHCTYADVLGYTFEIEDSGTPGIDGDITGFYTDVTATAENLWHYKANPATGTYDAIIAFYDLGQTHGTANWGFYGLTAKNYFSGALYFGQLDGAEKIVSDADTYLDLYAGSTVRIHGAGSITGQLTSTLAEGTAPFVVTSTTLNINLNADLLDGHESTYFQTALTTGNLTASGAISVSATRQVIGGSAAISHSSSAGYIHLPTGGSSGQIIRNSGSSGTGAWSTLTMPSTISANQVLYASSANTLGGSTGLEYNGTNLAVNTSGAVLMGSGAYISSDGSGNALFYSGANTDGYHIKVYAGSGTFEDSSGGDVYLYGGAKTGVGIDGLVVIGNANSNSHSIDAINSLFVGGKLEVDGYAYFDSLAQYFGGCTIADVPTGSQLAIWPEEGQMFTLNAQKNMTSENTGGIMNLMNNVSPSSDTKRGTMYGLLGGVYYQPGGAYSPDVENIYGLMFFVSLGAEATVDNAVVQQLYLSDDYGQTIVTSGAVTRASISLIAGGGNIEGFVVDSYLYDGFTSMTCFKANTMTTDGTVGTVYSFYDAGQSGATASWGFYGLSAHNYLSGDLTVGDLLPVSDNAKYLGKNDDDSPAAWKGLILKDQAGTGKYYRVEIYNDAIRIVDLTD